MSLPVTLVHTYAEYIIVLLKNDRVSNKVAIF